MMASMQNDSVSTGESLTQGINLERLDPSLMLAITHLLPKDRGRLLVERLLRHATLKYLDIAGHGLRETAVITLATIEAFARAYHMSKDTVLRYIEILESLGMLQRKRYADHTELLIPLTAWVPTVDAMVKLDALIATDRREKLQQLASTVKIRYLLLYGSPSSRSSLFHFLQEALTDVHSHLARRASTSKRELLQLRIEQALQRLQGDEGACLKQGDFQQLSGESLHTLLAQKGDFAARTESANGHLSAQQGDFPDRAGAPVRGNGTPLSSREEQNGHSNGEKGDPRFEGTAASIPAPAREGDFQVVSRAGAAGKGDLTTFLADQFEPEQTGKGDISHQPHDNHTAIAATKGDFQGPAGTQNSTKGDFQGPAAQAVAEKGDCLAVATALSLNVNGNTLSLKNDSSLTFNDDVGLSQAAFASLYAAEERQRVAYHLAMFVEQKDTNIPFYVTACKQYSRAIIRAAVIDVLVHTHFPKVDPHDHRGKPRNRGAWFTKASTTYAKPGAIIPAFVQVWIERPLSWRQINEALEQAAAEYGHYVNTEGDAAEMVRRWLRGECSEMALSEAVAGSPTQAQAMALPAKEEMSEEEAQALAAEIEQDGARHGYRIKAQASQDKDTWVVKVQWEGHAPFLMRARDTWRGHFTKVHAYYQRKQQLLLEQ